MGGGWEDGGGGEGREVRGVQGWVGGRRGARGRAPVQAGTLRPRPPGSALLSPPPAPTLNTHTPLSRRRDGLHRLTQLIFSKAQPKRLGTQVLTGPMLAGLVGAYVGAINAGAVPTIATAWQGVAEAGVRACVVGRRVWVVWACARV